MKSKKVMSVLFGVFYSSIFGGFVFVLFCFWVVFSTPRWICTIVDDEFPIKAETLVKVCHKFIRRGLKRAVNIEELERPTQKREREKK